MTIRGNFQFTVDGANKVNSESVRDCKRSMEQLEGVERLRTTGLSSQTRGVQFHSCSTFSPSHAVTSPFRKTEGMTKLLVRRCSDTSLCQLLCPELGVVLCLLSKRELLGSVIISAGSGS